MLVTSADNFYALLRFCSPYRTTNRFNPVLCEPCIIGIQRNVTDNSIESGEKLFGTETVSCSTKKMSHVQVREWKVSSCANTLLMQWSEVQCQHIEHTLMQFDWKKCDVQWKLHLIFLNEWHIFQSQGIQNQRLSHFLLYLFVWYTNMKMAFHI